MRNVVLTAGTILMLGASAVFAGGMQGASTGVAAGKEEAKAVDVNNKLCPVSEEMVGSMGEGYKIAHNGKVYKLCCEGCAAKFLDDPDKYSKIADEDAAKNSTGPKDAAEHNHDHK